MGSFIFFRLHNYNITQKRKLISKMAQTQMVNQLKFRITSLESQLHDKQKRLEQYQTIQSEADNKIKALNKVHTDKVRNLLNSIQILKKQKANLEGQSKQHKRSKLIQQLNKQIADQDLAIQVLRKFIYDDKGKEKGRQICDEVIIKALTKGPQRIRPLSREQLRMQIDKLKSINLNLEGKLKNRSNQRTGRGGNQLQSDNISDVSTISEQSVVNHDEQILRRMRDLQFQNENMKLQVNAKLKIIQQMKIEMKQKQKLKIDLQMAQNQQDIANRKLKTLQNLMKETKQQTNAKIIQLYERQIKVEELQIVSKENTDKLKEAQQNHNLLSEQMKIQKQQLQAEIDALKNENQQLILQNIAGKKRLDQLKKIIKDMDQINSKQKQDLKGKVDIFQKQLQKLIIENKKYTDAYKNVQNTLFTERAQWVEQKAKFIQQLKQSKQNAASKQLIGKYMQDISDLEDQNSKLKSLLQSGGGGGDDSILLQRLQGYKRKLQFYENKGDVSKQRQYYDQLFKKYNQLAQQFESYKRKYGPKNKQITRKQYIQINKKQESEYENMSSGISKLGLEEIDSDVLDNFDSSYQYEFVINEFGQKVKMPKLTDGDKELLKLMTSDLWGFVTDEKMDKKIQEAASFYVMDDDGPQQPIDYVKVRQIKNLSNPRGKKVTLYEQEINKLQGINESVSVTSALDKELNKFDSDVDIDMKKMPKGTSKNINNLALKDLSLSVDGISSVSSVKSGQSNLGKKRKIQDKGSRISITSKKISNKSSQIFDSQIESSLLDSDVSSHDIRESQLASINSDVQVNFRKKK